MGHYLSEMDDLGWERGLLPEPRGPKGPLPGPVLPPRRAPGADSLRKIEEAVKKLSAAGDMATLNDNDGNQVMEAFFLRLAEFYALPEACRGLILALLASPKDKDLLSVFADWLEENGKKQAKKVRKTANKAKG